jgi:hypothetical protein
VSEPITFKNLRRLKPFYGQGADRFTRPYQIDDRVVATDGRVICWVDNVSSECLPPSKEYLEGFRRHIDVTWASGKDTITEELPDLQLPPFLDPDLGAIRTYCDECGEPTLCRFSLRLFGPEWIFDVFYLVMIKQLPGLKISLNHPDQGVPLLFSWELGGGLLMPMRISGIGYGNRSLLRHEPLITKGGAA